MDIPELTLVVPNDERLYDLYKNKVEQHNNMIKFNETPDSGFDLFIPDENTLLQFNTKLIDLKVKASMKDNNKYIGYYVYPRSSISKSPLMLANHVGIIDSGYRGNIKAAFRSFEDTVILKETRILQICHPSLKPFYVRLYNNEDVLNTTSRGSGGFGSTGI